MCNRISFICVAICLMLFTGVAYGDRQTIDPTLTYVAMPLQEAPVIDGVIEGEAWQYAGGSQQEGLNSSWVIQFDAAAEDFMVGGANPVTTTDGPFGTEDMRIQIFAGYTETDLYVGVRVQDDFLNSDNADAESANGETWKDDGVEVFIDGDNSNFETSDTSGTNPEIIDTGGQYVITINNAYREAEAGNPGYGEDAAWYAMTQTNDAGNGYDAEFRISLEELGNPQQGDIIGFTVGVNDDDGFGGDPDNQYIWTGATHEEATYGNLVLGPRVYTAPKVTTAPTLDGEMGDGEYADAELVSIDTHSGMYTGYDNDWPEGDHSFEFKVVHDADNIYVFVMASDDQVSTDTADAGTEDGNTWNDDSVEVFIDGDNSDDVIQFQNNEHGADEFEGQYVLTANGARRDNEANNPSWGEDAQWFGAATMTDSSYAAEFRISKEGIMNPADGDTIGFNVGINDDDENVFGNEPKTQLTWNGNPHMEMSYGNLILSAGGTSVADWSLF